MCFQSPWLPFSRVLVTSPWRRVAGLTSWFVTGCDRVQAWGMAIRRSGVLSHLRIESQLYIYLVNELAGRGKPKTPCVCGVPQVRGATYAA